MWLALGSIAVGLALLVWSADKFVEGATSMAKHLGISTMIIGITIVGFGTSAPEILVSVIAVLDDSPDIAIEPKGGPGRGRALGASEVKYFGQVLPTAKLVTYRIEMKRVIMRKLVMGIADASMEVDGRGSLKTHVLRAIQTRHIFTQVSIRVLSV